MSRTAEVAANPPKLARRESETTGAIFKMKSAKLYVPIVTLSIKDNIKLLKNIKQGFKRIISCNKYRSEVTKQPKNNKLDYIINAAFMNISGFFFFCSIMSKIIQDFILTILYGISQNRRF